MLLSQTRQAPPLTNHSAPNHQNTDHRHLHLITVCIKSTHTHHSMSGLVCINITCMLTLRTPHDLLTCFQESPHVFSPFRVSAPYLQRLQYLQRFQLQGSRYLLTTKDSVIIHSSQDTILLHCLLTCTSATAHTGFQ